jgi:hypothetical protein
MRAPAAGQMCLALSILSFTLLAAAPVRAQNCLPSASANNHNAECGAGLCVERVCVNTLFRNALLCGQGLAGPSAPTVNLGGVNLPILGSWVASASAPCGASDDALSVALSEVDEGQHRLVVSSGALRSEPFFVKIGDLAGPQGPAGPIGATGPIGPKGDPGVAGSAGAKGDIGATGAVGPKGDPGVAGSAGAKGDIGATGAIGPKGDLGVAGSAGAKGDPGVAGSAGAKGDTGAIGPKGDPGVAGSTGAKGDTGAAGPQGPAGPAGTGSTSTTQNTALYEFSHRPCDPLPSQPLFEHAMVTTSPTCSYVVTQSDNPTCEAGCTFVNDPNLQINGACIQFGCVGPGGSFGCQQGCLKFATLYSGACSCSQKFIGFSTN